METFQQQLVHQMWTVETYLSVKYSKWHRSKYTGIAELNIRLTILTMSWKTHFQDICCATVISLSVHGRIGICHANKQTNKNRKNKQKTIKKQNRETDFCSEYPTSQLLSWWGSRWYGDAMILYHNYPPGDPFITQVMKGSHGYVLLILHFWM